MAYGKKKRRKVMTSIPSYDKMIRAKRLAEVNMFREDLRQAEARRDYLLELGNIRSALYGNLSPGVQHPLHARRDENRRVALKGLTNRAENFVASLE